MEHCISSLPGSWLLASRVTNWSRFALSFLGFKTENQDFSHCPVVKTSPSNAMGARSIPGQGDTTPTSLEAKTKQNRNNTVANSIKFFKWSVSKKEKILKISPARSPSEQGHLGQLVICLTPVLPVVIQKKKKKIKKKSSAEGEMIHDV